MYFTPAQWQQWYTFVLVKGSCFPSISILPAFTSFLIRSLCYRPSFATSLSLNPSFLGSVVLSRVSLAAEDLGVLIWFLFRRFASYTNYMLNMSALAAAEGTHPCGVFFLALLNSVLSRRRFADDWH